MTTYNTGNPLGSSDPRDLYDNAENLDVAVNSEEPQWLDRFGRPRLPLMEQERQFVASQDSREDQFQSAQSSREAVFSDFLQASGYQDLGEYAPGIEITAHNQYVTFGGQPYLLKPSIPVPYTTSGEWTGDDFKLIGDDSLRQDLANPDMGAAMVARGVVAVDSIADLLALPEGQRKEGLRYLVKGYHAGSDVGGGEFYWSSDSDKTEHDGGYVIDPSHPSALFSPSWYTTTQSGDGVFVRISRNSEVFLEEYGARTGFTIDYEFANALTKAEADCSILKSLAGSTFTVTQALSAGQVNIDLMSDIVSEVAGTTLTVGYNSTAKLATSLSSDYVPFNGPAIVSLSSVEGLEVGDLISIVTNDVFHPSRYYVYTCGITSTVAYISGNNVYLNHEIPFPLSASGSRVIALQPSKSSIKNIRFVGPATLQKQG